MTASFTSVKPVASCAAKDVIGLSAGVAGRIAIVKFRTLTLLKTGPILGCSVFMNHGGNSAIKDRSGCTSTVTFLGSGLQKLPPCREAIGMFKSVISGCFWSCEVQPAAPSPTSSRLTCILENEGRRGEEGVEKVMSWVGEDAVSTRSEI